MSLNLHFYGASGMVTGSCFLLQDERTKILIECGMYQGMEESETLNHAPFEFAVDELDAVVITHAHIDHVGRLPLLVRRGYKGPIYMTAATQALADLTLTDSAKIAQEDDPEMVLYEFSDVVQTMQQVRTFAYHTPILVGDFECVFVDAGHILGSASVVVRHKDAGHTKDIVFSGDLGNTPQPLIKPTEHIQHADVVIMETTYGNRLHDREDPKHILLGEIQAVEESGGTLLMPSFSLERAQELLHYIDHLKKDGSMLNETPVYLDSPMAIRATEVFGQFKSLYNSELSAHSKKDDPFDFPGLLMTLKAHQSKAIERVSGPKVIIAGSGMMEGGRILHHAKIYLEDERNRLFFVGYQGVDTLGRAILEGADSIEIDGSYVHIRAHVGSTGVFSAHADQQQLLHWLESMQGVSKAFLVHGDDDARESFSTMVSRSSREMQVELPDPNSSYVL